MSTRVVVLDDIRAIGPQWDAIVRDAPLPNVFMLSDWLAAAGTSGRASIVAVYDGAELLGGLALERVLRPGFVTYRFLGYQLTPDHIDILAAPGSALVVVDAVAEWLRRPGQRYLELVGVDGDALVLGALGSPSVLESHGIHRFAVLPETYEEYFVSRSRSVRSSATREAKRFAQAGVEIASVPRDAEAIDRAISSMFRLHAELFGGTSQLLPHADAYSRALGAVARTGDAMLVEARVGDRTIAVDAWSTVGPRWGSLQGGRDPDPAFHGIGRQMLLHVVRMAIDAGVQSLDFLRGFDGWKERMATDSAPLYEARMATSTLAGAAARAANRLEYEYRRRRSRAAVDSVSVKEDA